MRAAAAVRAVGKRLGGGRGYALLGTGMGWIAYGIGIIEDHRPAVAKGTVVLTSWWSLTWWGAVWIACGAVAVVCSVRRPGRDTIGWFLAALPPIIWAAAYTIATTTGRFPTAWTGVPAWCVPIELLGVAALLSRQLEAAVARLLVAGEQIARLQRELAVANERIAELQQGDARG